MPLLCASRKAGGLILFLFFNPFQLVRINVICRLLHALIEVICKAGREGAGMTRAGVMRARRSRNESRNATSQRRIKGMLPAGTPVALTVSAPPRRLRVTISTIILLGRLRAISGVPVDEDPTSGPRKSSPEGFFG